MVLESILNNCGKKKNLLTWTKIIDINCITYISMFSVIIITDTLKILSQIVVQRGNERKPSSLFTTRQG